MNGIQTLQAALASTQFLTANYINDLSDAELLMRPVPGANHAAWQLGHVIAAEIHLVRMELPEAAYPELPAGFADAHAQTQTGKDGPDGFRSKADYVKLFNAVRQATIDTVGKLQDGDLDRATKGPLAKFAPRLGDLFVLVSNHALMHSGQFSVLRRKLGKPVLF